MPSSRAVLSDATVCWPCLLPQLLLLLRTVMHAPQAAHCSV